LKIFNLLYIYKVREKFMKRKFLKFLFFSFSVFVVSGIGGACKKECYAQSGIKNFHEMLKLPDILTENAFKILRSDNFIGAFTSIMPSLVLYNPNKPATNLSELNKDVLLKKMFPFLNFKNGVADLKFYNDEFGTNLKLYLKESREDYFTNSREKSLLLITILEGTPHAEGLFHAFLGLFDKNGNLLTTSSPFPKRNVDVSSGHDYGLGNYNYDKDPAHFGGDEGKFGFYKAKGITYILFVSTSWPNGTCGSDRALLYRFKKGWFKLIQVVDKKSLIKFKYNDPARNYEFSYAPFEIKIKLVDDKMVINTVPVMAQDATSLNNPCPESEYGVMKWNKSKSKFTFSKF